MMQRIVDKTKTAARIVATLGLLAAACGDDDPTGPGAQSSNLRVVHASPGATPIDVFVDGGSVFQDVTYGQVSSYNALTAGSHRIQARPANMSNALFEVSQDLAAGTKYTVFASGPVATIEPYMLVDDTTAPASGNARLRFAHVSPSAGSVDVYITAPGADLALETPDLSNVQFRTASAYFDLLAGTYRLRLTPTGTKTMVVDSGILTLVAGQARTAAALDAPGGGSPFSAAVLADRN